MADTPSLDFETLAALDDLLVVLRFRARHRINTPPSDDLEMLLQKVGWLYDPSISRFTPQGEEAMTDALTGDDTELAYLASCCVFSQRRLASMTWKPPFGQDA